MSRNYYINQIKDLSTNFDDKTKSNILTELDKTVKYADSEYINIIDPIYEELEGVIDNYYDKIEKAKSKQPTPDW